MSNCIGTMRRALTRLGLYPAFTAVEAKEAETENLVRERAVALGELSKSSASFKEKSAEIEATAERRKEDLKALLQHIRHIDVASASARALIERIIGH